MKKVRVDDRTYYKKSQNHGIGLFAKVKIKKGQIVTAFKGQKTKKDHMHTLWISNKFGILVENKAKYANHDWINPNARSYGKILIAKKDIEKDDEITWDYSVGYAYDQSFNPDLPTYDNNDKALIQFSIDNNNFDLFAQCCQDPLLETIEIVPDGEKYYYPAFSYILSYGTFEMLSYILGKDLIKKGTIIDELNYLDTQELDQEKIDILSKYLF